MHFGSKSTVWVVLVLSISTIIVVDAADTSIISGPHCRGECSNQAYNDGVAHLIDILVNETKNVPRKTDHEHYKYIHKYPDTNSSVVIGGATCDRDLIKWGCWRCLVVAKDEIKSGCEHTDDGSVILGDCSMWFAKIH
ncbi:hypothetical protein LINPERHAP1_LOCUS9710 [Linum perenne]